MSQAQPLLMAGGSVLMKNGICHVLNDHPRYSIVADYEGVHHLAAEAACLPHNAIILLLCDAADDMVAAARCLHVATPQLLLLVMGHTTDLRSIAALYCAWGNYLHYQECEALPAALDELSTRGWLPNNWARDSRQHWHEGAAAPQELILKIALLTPKEREVLRAVKQSAGLPFKLVADVLQMNYKTLQHHIENIYRKLELRSKAELTVWLERCGEM